jgi:hypothetical protein
LEFGKGELAAMLIYLEMAVSSENNPSFGPANLKTKPALIPAFIQLRLEFGEAEILADFSIHWLLDYFGQYKRSRI